MTVKLFLCILMCGGILANVEIKQTERSDILLAQIEAFFEKPIVDEEIFKSILESGEIDGNFSSHQAFLIFEYALNRYPEFMTKKVIGETFKKTVLEAYILSKDNQKTKRSKALMAAAYHARELTTVNVIVGSLLELLHTLIHPRESDVIFNHIDVIMVPIVNLDSHLLITESYGSDKFETYKEKRKNMNSNYCKFVQKKRRNGHNN